MDAERTPVRTERALVNHVKDYCLTVFVSVVIVVLSTIPIPENPPLGDVPLIDKWVHMVMYGGLSLVMWVDHVMRAGRMMTWKWGLAMLLWPAVLGGLMELVQGYLTTCRSGDWIDFEADAVGAVLATLLCAYLNKLWKERTSARR